MKRKKSIMDRFAVWIVDVVIDHILFVSLSIIVIIFGFVSLATTVGSGDTGTVIDSHGKYYSAKNIIHRGSGHGLQFVDVSTGLVVVVRGNATVEYDQ